MSLEPGPRRAGGRSRAPLGTVYRYDPRGERQREREPASAAPERLFDHRPPAEREADEPSSRADHGWDEPNYGFRPAAGYDYGSDPRDDPGWEARSVSGYGLGWRGGSRRGPFAGRGPKGYRRSDARVREDVCDRLVAAGDIDASGMEVDVRDGEVTISGTARDRWQKRRAEDVTEHVLGVRDVHNRLRIAPPPERGAGE